MCLHFKGNEQQLNDDINEKLSMQNGSVKPQKNLVTEELASSGNVNFTYLFSLTSCNHLPPSDCSLYSQENGFPVKMYYQIKSFVKKEKVLCKK